MRQINSNWNRDLVILVPKQQNFVCLVKVQNVLVRFIWRFLEVLVIILGVNLYLFFTLLFSIDFFFSLLVGTYRYGCLRGVTISSTGCNPGPSVSFVIEHSYWKAKILFVFQCSPSSRLVGSIKNNSTHDRGVQISWIMQITVIVNICSRWTAFILWGLGVATGRILHLSSVIAFHTKTGLIIAAKDFQKLFALLEIMTLGNGSGTTVIKKICATVHKDWIWSVGVSYRRRSDRINNLCSWFYRWKGIFITWGQSVGVLNSYQTMWLFSSLRTAELSYNDLIPKFFFCGRIPMFSWKIQ